MESGSSTCSCSLKDQIKKAVEEAISHAELINDEHVTQLIDKLESWINLSLTKLITDATKPLLDKVDALENKVVVYKANFMELDEGIDDLEYICEIEVDDIKQYSCRSCLRLYHLPLPKGIKESSSDCLCKVKQIFEEEHQLPVTDDWFDRVQRIGSYKSQGQQKFITSHHTTA